MSYLSRDDIKNLRSTSKDIDLLISHTLFQSVVVPFNPEIYGMVLGAQGDGSSSNNLPRFLRREYDNPNLYDGPGVKVFKEFGRHMKKFGMSFEVDEGGLS